MPAVAGFRKQGANKGASLAFLISTPESGVDSIALTYSLLDPIMTVVRPIVALVTGLVAGIAQNIMPGSYEESLKQSPNLACPIDGCCDGTDCDPADHARHHTFFEKLRAGMRFAFDDLMADLAVWFLLGLLLAGVISALVPESFITDSLGGGIVGYLGMLVLSLPMYVCASMSTPVAAALVMKGMSPGAALVLLMAGPATNMATITVVGGTMGKRTLGIYLTAIILCTLAAAYATDAIYLTLGVSAKATAGAAAAELFPWWLELSAALLLAALIARQLWKKVHGALPTLVRTEELPEKERPSAGCSCGDTGPGST